MTSGYLMLASRMLSSPSEDREISHVRVEGIAKMTPADHSQKSLQRLVSVIRPPETPLENNPRSSTSDYPPVPPDLQLLIGEYGSGSFEYEESGAIVRVHNPYESEYWRKQEKYLDLLRYFKVQFGEEYIPYPIYPEEGGLLPWGSGEGRKHYFWKMDGDPPAWPVIVMYDIEIFTRFDMTMVQFLEKLLCGELDCSFIGGTDEPNNCLDPAKLIFDPRILPA